MLTIFDSKVITALKENSINNFKDKGNNKHFYIENQMFQNGGNINREIDNINSYILNSLESKNLSTDELNSNNYISNEMLINISTDIMGIIKNNPITDVFLIFDTIETNQDPSELVEKQGIHIKSNNLEKNNLNENLDLYLERGPVDIANNLKINTNSNWKEKYIFGRDYSNKEFFYKPLNEAKEHGDKYIRDFGFWGKPSIITNDNCKVVTYSIPLINNEGMPYGILGIGIDSDYFSKFFKSDELNKLDAYAFYVESKETNKDIFNLESIVSMDNTSKEFLENYKNKSTKVRMVSEDIYELTSKEDTNNAIYIFKKQLDLYNFNNKFSDEELNIVLFLKDNNLFNQVNKLKDALKNSIIISTAVGVIIAIILVRRVTKPTRVLAEKVRQSNPREPLSLEKIGITEIDDLSSAITNLSKNVADESSKLNKIINLLNIPFGAFKHMKGEESVYCTNGLLSILGVDGVHESDEYIDIEKFDLIIKEALKNKYENEDNIYIIKTHGQEDSLIKVIVQEEEFGSFGIITDVTEEILEKAKIEYDRDHDFLTGLLNRRSFRRLCKDKIENDNVEYAAFITFDLDNLKFINDIYGHEYGDQYIKEAASIIKEFEKYNALVGRMSGDEFLVFIYGYQNKIQILSIVEEIHNKMKNTIFDLPYYNYKKVKIRSSVGISWYPEDGYDYDLLVKYSDFAMYKIKNTVKGSIAEFDKDEYNERAFLMNNRNSLEQLIDEELVYYVFQPIIDAHTGKVYAYEMLMRSEVESLKNPYKILAIAAAESRLYELERLTWFKSLETVDKHSEELEDSKIFINSLPNHLLSEKDLKNLINKYEKYFDRVVIELLENERHDLKFTLEKINQIEKFGAKVAIDDFGSGYNNESVLIEVTPSFIKIDMEIVKEIHKDLNRQDIIKNIISYSSKRGIKVIAEGIETREELEKLIELGVDYIQGYYISKPAINPPSINEGVVQEILDINKGII